MAHGVIRYSPDVIAAVIDPDFAGRRLADVLPYLGRDAPIVASVAEGLRFEPTALLIGIAPAGGRLPDDFRDALVAIDVVGLSYREAARALRVREATITTRLHRARQRVAAALTSVDPPTAPRSRAPAERPPALEPET